ncbi:uncharacterized protein M421DRAFT_9928 [Didymella exigua CBS 183.55]|uniref:Zn(2)-C6 fungal-type domain-containing protein n=1 Tax=Didymella exigua CBS 183.55 TaxID=1150837 RepID=A0A6A5R7J9_9PLEO|nr:uncharacterized protein M421DRAFT_9928 [Didymella exigua CBS 183.55]KAF1923148.1 hypothetical protein M421DRAFT_9928 [Didymella exigua CBS 183.55]
MASNYGDPDTRMGGGPGPYGNHNGTPPAQQQHQDLTDPDLQLQEKLQQFSNQVMHSGPQQHQYQQPAPMAPLQGAHPHFQPQQRPTHSPQQMAHVAMSLGEHTEQFDPNDPNRKRSKVSRACDECRRKKIRCDATSENGPEACSSCKRTGARCQFSRQPMKRGPSKGYIKELADRLNSLESQIQQPQGQQFDLQNLTEQNFADIQSPPQFHRKRTHSMSEGFQDAFGRSSWSGQDRGNNHPLEHAMLSLLTSQETPLNGDRRTSFGDMTLAGNLITGSHEGTLKAYYNLIHPTLPVLPHDSNSLNRLSNCPPKLREAFFLSLDVCVRSFAPRALPQNDTSVTQLLHQTFASVDVAKLVLGDSDPSRQFYNNLVYCQSLLLLALASDKPGPGTVGSISQLLGQIAGCITEAGFNDTRVLTSLKEHDQDAFQGARRVFWSALILDRFHASSRSKDIMLPLHSGSLTRDDYAALGDLGYHLARGAKIVGQVAAVNRAGSVPSIEPSSPFASLPLAAASPEAIYLNGQLTGYQESIDITDLTDNSPPHLAYHYMRVFVGRLSSRNILSTELLGLTKELLRNLSNGTITPIHHICASLVATSLVELSDIIETQVEAHAAMKEMSDALNNGQIIHRSLDHAGWDAAIREILHQKQAPSPIANAVQEQTPSAPEPNMAGLQHLAAAAVGEREGTEPRPVSSGGNGAQSQNHESSLANTEHDLSAAMAAASDAAMAQATAAAAQQQLTASSPSAKNGNNFESSALKQDDFMASLS